MRSRILAETRLRVLLVVFDERRRSDDVQRTLRLATVSLQISRGRV